MTELMIGTEQVLEPLFVPPPPAYHAAPDTLGPRKPNTKHSPHGDVLSPTSPEDPKLITTEQRAAFMRQREGGGAEVRTE